jgi:uncharacterized repeat protein (TIGR03837 family)
MLWDLFCRVIDNYGDAGVCWRLACDLASHGERVRLWLDDRRPLAWMAPAGHADVEVIGWIEPAPEREPGDVVVEAFGCDPPAGFVARMAAAPRAPVWINLEYLSAESFVERCHGLPSPQLSGPGTGLTKWFFYPGFTPATGGLIRETDLARRRQRFDRDAWLHTLGVETRPGERLVSLFCYDSAPLSALPAALAGEPTLLLAAAGTLAPFTKGALRCISLPRLTQINYDSLLWACDLNFVRGEDSFVRAQWAAKPFIWQIYPQHDAAHRTKLQAFADLYLAGAPDGLAQPLRSLWAAWNGAAGELLLPEPEAWRAHARSWCEQLQSQEDLGTQLIRFAGEKG